MNINSARDLKAEFLDLLPDSSMEEHLSDRVMQSAVGRAFSLAGPSAQSILATPVVYSYARMQASRGHPVVGVRPNIAFGIQSGEGEDFKLAVRVQRRDLMRDDVLENIKKRASGEVDIRYVGQVRAYFNWGFLRRTRTPQQTKQRPIQLGASIGHQNVTAGTVGAFVTDAGGNRFVLSNNHVLAAENSGKPGDGVLQPGKYDGGRSPRDVVAILDRRVDLLTGNQRNLVDCALARLAGGVDIDPTTVAGCGKLRGVADPIDKKDIPVCKVGRTTGLTNGRVVAFEIDRVTVTYPTLGNVRFDGQVEIGGLDGRPFSQPGDSGALVVRHDTYEAIGLLNGGGYDPKYSDEHLTYVSSMEIILDKLAAKLLI